MRAMTPEERDALLRQPRNAVLATVDAHGRPHAVPVWFRWDGEALRVITDHGSQKHRNVERAGYAALCIEDGRLGYVTALGPVTVADPLTYDERLALHTHYRGEEAARKIVDRGGHERMVLLLLRPERWIG